MIACAVLVAAPSWAQSEAYRLAAALAELGPRTSGSVAHSRAEALLLSELRRQGLTDVERIPDSNGDGWVNLTGILPGLEPDEILLTAHYDTVANSPGALDDASGCAVVLAAIGHLRTSRLRHSVRVVLFDGEEAGQRGSNAFLSQRTSSAPALRAAVDLDMVGRKGVRRGIIHVLSGGPSDGPAPPPKWLLAAALNAARKDRHQIMMGDSLFPIPGQLSERISRSGFRADAGIFASQGIPSLLFSDVSLFDFDEAYHTPADVAARLDPDRLDDWSDYLVTLVRTVDESVTGEDVAGGADSRYLVIADRVWPRSLLRIVVVGLGVLLLGLLIVRRRVLSARGVRAGIAFAAATVLAGWFAPLSAAVFLPPALLLGLAAPQPEGRGIPGLIVGLAPLIGFGLFEIVALARHWIRGWYFGFAGVGLTLLALACYVIWRTSRPRFGEQSGQRREISDPTTPPGASPEMP